MPDSCPLSPLRIIDLTYVEVRNSSRRCSERGRRNSACSTARRRWRWRNETRRDAHGMRTTLTWTTHDAAVGFKWLSWNTIMLRRSRALNTKSELGHGRRLAERSRLSLAHAAFSLRSFRLLQVCLLVVACALTMTNLFEEYRVPSIGTSANSFCMSPTT